MLKKLFVLFLTFAKIGSITFGGGLTMLPLLTREIVEKENGQQNRNYSTITLLVNVHPVLLQLIQPHL